MSAEPYLRHFCTGCGGELTAHGPVHGEPSGTRYLICDECGDIGCIEVAPGNPRPTGWNREAVTSTVAPDPPSSL